VARIEDIGAKGDGVARVDGADIFTPLTAPGDVAVIDAKDGRGRLIELKERGPARAEPPCPQYGVCGGCALQHVSAAFYASWKRERVVEALKRAGLAEAAVGEIILMPTASRRRATFAFRRPAFGFNGRRSREVVDLDHCLILHPDLEKRLPALRALAGELSGDAFDLTATQCLNGLDVNIVGRVREPQGEGLSRLIAAAKTAGARRVAIDGAPAFVLDPPVVAFGGVAVSPPPGAFLQASKEGENRLAALVLDALVGARRVADLFSGVGSFTFPIARAASVFAVDSDKAAIAALDAAARDAQRDGAGLKDIRSDARDLLERPLLAGELNAFDAVCFDPPRAGAKAQAEEIAKSRVSRVVGVSCNPSTFARDAAILSRGGYTLIRATPVDQFVYSPHIELVGEFRRKP
jgi:23S rRNA (uracil1939-C5)-methyltransferase